MMVTKSAPSPWIFIIESLHTYLLTRKAQQFLQTHPPQLTFSTIYSQL